MEGPHFGAASFEVNMATIHIHDSIVNDGRMVASSARLRKSGLTGNLSDMLNICKNNQLHTGSMNINSLLVHFNLYRKKEI